ncbi:hypothetical protein [Sulfobacillus thermosulfidooxidans]|uniref:hypothetical protein n=1 Tax=Sulfobacillus thermosulfidooxidans TaxID=28034 RepID=UPI0006B49CC7|nr:hypothetical protein [Sulfobacillus thermosulfidooxidans]
MTPDSDPRVCVWTAAMDGLEVFVPIPVSVVATGEAAIREFLQAHGFPGLTWRIVWSLSVAESSEEGA